MAIGPDRILNHYKGFGEFSIEKKIAFIVMEFERIIDAKIVHEHYRTLAYFTTEEQDFDWPVVNNAVREGKVGYHFEFEHESFRETFTKAERVKIYTTLRKRYCNEGWETVYFEEFGGFMNVALIRKDEIC